MLEIKVTGTLFEASGNAAIAILERAENEARYYVAGQALANVHLILDRSIMHPTPYYETQIEMRHGVSDTVVDDRGVIYGPWLEGTSFRNQITRFKGYHAFRQATQMTQRRVKDIANPFFARAVEEIGGYSV